MNRAITKIENFVQICDILGIEAYQAKNKYADVVAISDKTVNPNGGYCDKYCYWFNADYVKQIIDTANTK